MVPPKPKLDPVGKLAAYYHTKGAIHAIDTILAGAALAPDMGILLAAMRKMRDKIQAEQDELVKETPHG